jgi:hypothetical protein
MEDENLHDLIRQYRSKGLDDIQIRKALQGSYSEEVINTQLQERPPAPYEPPVQSIAEKTPKHSKTKYLWFLIPAVVLLFVIVIQQIYKHHQEQLTYNEVVRVSKVLDGSEWSAGNVSGPRCDSLVPGDIYDDYSGCAVTY